MKSRILLADDEATFRETFSKVLTEEGMDVTAVTNGTDAIKAVRDRTFDVAILDIQMPGADGIKVLGEIMKVRPHTRVIIITAYGTVEMAVEAIKLGASDYVMKPIIFDDVIIKIRQQLQYQELTMENLELKQQLDGKVGLEQIIGNAAVMQPVFQTIRKVAGTRSNVLVTGNSGTGKELVARAIHSLGTTSSKRFVAVNCSAIAEGLLESELFGHKKGSFTSAVADKKGFFEIADGGTLFLDEIGYMSTSCQVKLLRAVEDRQILPVGSTDPVDVTLRLIAATNKDLKSEIKTGHFREDLYYRINVVGIHLPPLSERKEDIPALVAHFVGKFNRQMGKNCSGPTAEAMEMLMNHEWKGNIRELQNVIERAIIFADTDRITSADIGLMSPVSMDSDQDRENLSDVIRMCERQHILRILKRHPGSKADAAKALGIGLSSLYRKIEELGVSQTD